MNGYQPIRSMRIPVLLMLFGLVATARASVQPDALKCEYRAAPLGIDVVRPRLSWILKSDQRGQKQTAYRILVATSRQKLAADEGDLWDSGKVQSDETIHIEYADKPLASRMRSHWKVKVWDKDGKPSAWSSPAMWSMSLLRRSDWQALWIGAPPDDPRPLTTAHKGYRSGLEASPDVEKWICIDLGQRQEIDTIRLYPARSNDTKPKTSGFLFPLRFRVDVSNHPKFLPGQCRTVLDRTAADEQNPGAAVWTGKIKPTRARYVRLVVTRLAKRSERTYGVALAGIDLLGDGNNLTQGENVKGYPGDPRIPPSPLLRKLFSISGQVRQAQVSVTSLGDYELRLNGRRVGDHLLTPEWTDYHRRVQYQTYDVTDLLKQGEDVIGATLGDGWYAGRLGLVRWSKVAPRRGVYGLDRRLMLRLDIEKVDGSRQTVVSDGSWKIHLDGPIRSADNFLGEVYDARKEQPGWDRGGFDDSAWQPVTVDRSHKAQLVGQMSEPIRIVEQLKPIAITELKPGVYIFDLGQNMAGWCRIRLAGPAGTTVTLRHGEMLNQDGTLYTANLGSATQTDRFILDDKAEREFQPHFTYHGFRYVEVTGLKQKPKLDMLTGCVIASDACMAGKFECSSPLLNQLMRNIVWTQRANMYGVPTDCPQRDERMGWMGDFQTFSQAAIFNMDMAAFLTKWIRDIRDAQTADGQYAYFAPFPTDPSKQVYRFPAWDDAGVIVPWRMYQNYADKRVLQQHFDSAKRFIEHVRRHPIPPRKVSGNDWLNGDMIVLEGWPRTGGTVPSDVFSVAFFAHSTELVAKMAKVLGRREDARRYGKLFQEIKAAFNRDYVSPDGRIQGDTQAGYALALRFNLLDEPMRRKAIGHLLEGIRRYHGHLSTGIQVSHRAMLELTRNGHHREACRIINLRTCPSWGFMIDMGATTIWERWDGCIEGRPNPDRMNSFNHYAFGAVGEWIWRHIVGINPDDDHPGFKHFVIRPRPCSGLTWAKGRYDSIRGTIVSDWKTDGDRFRLNVANRASAARIDRSQ